MKKGLNRSVRGTRRKLFKRVFREEALNLAGRSEAEMSWVSWVLIFSVAFFVAGCRVTASLTFRASNGANLSFYTSPVCVNGAFGCPEEWSFADAPLVTVQERHCSALFGKDCGVGDQASFEETFARFSGKVLIEEFLKKSCNSCFSKALLSRSSENYKVAERINASVWLHVFDKNARRKYVPGNYLYWTPSLGICQSRKRIPAFQCEHSRHEMDDNYMSTLFELLEKGGVSISISGALSENAWQIMYDGQLYAAFVYVTGFAYIIVGAVFCPVIYFMNDDIKTMQTTLLLTNGIPCFFLGVIILIGGWHSSTNLKPSVQVYATFMFFFEYFGSCVLAGMFFSTRLRQVQMMTASPVSSFKFWKVGNRVGFGLLAFCIFLDIATFMQLTFANPGFEIVVALIMAFGLFVMSVYYYRRTTKFLAHVTRYFEKMAARTSMDSGDNNPDSPPNMALRSLHRVGRLLRYSTVINIVLFFSLPPLGLSGSVVYGFFAPTSFFFSSIYLLWLRLIASCIQLQMCRKPKQRGKDMRDDDTELSHSFEPPLDLRAGPKVATPPDVADVDDVDVVNPAKSLELQSTSRTTS